MIKRKKDIVSKNYLERIPSCPEAISWDDDEKGIVTLHIENKGLVKRITQLLLKKPKVSHIHLDEMGSFIWTVMDGQKDIIEIGKEIEAHFGEQAQPIYERLARYFQILDSYGFIKWN